MAVALELPRIDVVNRSCNAIQRPAADTATLAASDSMTWNMRMVAAETLTPALVSFSTDVARVTLPAL